MQETINRKDRMKRLVATISAVTLLVSVVWYYQTHKYEAVINDSFPVYSVVEDGQEPISYQHCTKCSQGVYLPHDGKEQCTYCGAKPKA